jgi:hypothetical protein
VPAGGRFKGRPIDGSAGTLSDSPSQRPQQIIESPVVRMLLADPLESSTRNGIPPLRMSQQRFHSANQSVMALKYKNLLINIEISL